MGPLKRKEPVSSRPYMITPDTPLRELMDKYCKIKVSFFQF